VITSFQSFRFGRPVAFIGLANYQSLLGDSNFHSSLWTTLVYTGVVTGIEFALGMGLTLLLKEEIPLQRLIRSTLMIPMIIAPVVVGIIWRLLYNSDVGLFSYLMERATGNPIHVLSSQALALPGLILVDIWEWTPFMFLILLAGIQSLPQEPFEAAWVDGAGPLGGICTPDATDAAAGDCCCRFDSGIGRLHHLRPGLRPHPGGARHGDRAGNSDDLQDGVPLLSNRLCRIYGAFFTGPSDVPLGGNRTHAARQHTQRRATGGMTFSYSGGSIWR
jgi:hypothetical protein